MNLAAACAGGLPCAYKGKRSLRSAARFRVWSAWYSHRGICIAVIAAMLAMIACAASAACAAATPEAAYADGITEVLTAPGRWLQQQFGLVALGQSSGTFVVDAYPVSVHPEDVVAVFVTVVVVGFLAVWYPVRYFSRRLIG